LLAALETLQNYDVGIGVTVSFNAANHQGLDKVYLTSIDSGKFVLVPVK
jgi:ABC-type branched-subunit amino acid transport system substrate-binding protein